MICIGGVPGLKRHFGGASPQIFYMIHRGGRIHPIHTRILYSQSHLWTCGDIFESSKLKAQSSNVSFATFQWKETFKLWALSFETAFENVTPSGIGCTYKNLVHTLYIQLSWCMYIHTCTYIFSDAYIHTNIHTYIYTFCTYVCTYIFSDTCIYIFSDTYIYTYKHTSSKRISTYIFAHTCTSLLMHVHTCECMMKDVCTDTCTCTSLLMHIHTSDTYTHT